MAIIGTGGQGTVNMKQLFQEQDIRIAALSDINQVSDYSMFYYGGTAGLKPPWTWSPSAMARLAPPIMITKRCWPRKTSMR